MTNVSFGQLPASTPTSTSGVVAYDPALPANAQDVLIPSALLVGQTGATGATGATGPAGPTGPAGSAGAALTLNGAAAPTALDPSAFSSTGSQLTISELFFLSLADSGPIQSTDKMLLIRGTTALSLTGANLAAGLLTIGAQSITIGTISAQVSTIAFPVTGTLANYENPPNLFYEDNSGSFVALPGGSTVTSNSFTFTHPGLSTGTYTISVEDENNVRAISNSFNAALAVATAATISGAPTSGVAGTAITGVSDTLTPSNATAYAALVTGGADQGSRVAFTGTSVPSLTPASAGTYTIAIYAAMTGGTALATSTSITVSATVATAATIGTAPSTGTRGVAITGVTDTLTPGGATAYAVLALAGVDEGSRVAFTGTTMPNLTPQATGSYTLKIYAAATGGTALATSSTITVSAATATAATISGAPSTGTRGVAITGLTDTLTPAYANAYAVLAVGGADEGTRQLFSGTSVPSLTPAATGTYTVVIYAALTGGTALATSSAITVAAATATAATIGTAPSTGTTGTAITGVTDTLTPSYANGYAVLSVSGADEGSRVVFTGTTLPSLTPAATGSYTIKVYAASTGSSALATSTAITVSAAVATAATIAGAPSTGSQGVAITGITDTLTPSAAQAYACLALAGTDEGTRTAFTGTSYPSKTPASTGSYTAKIYAAATGGTALATSGTITVSAAGAPSIGSGVAATGLLDASRAGSLFSDAGLTTAQTTNGGTVQGWKDASTGGYNFTGSSSAFGTLVTAAQNGLNAVQFGAGTNQYLNGASALVSFIQSQVSNAGSGGLTIALTMKYLATPNTNDVNFTADDGGGNGIAIHPGYTLYGNASNNSTTSPANGALAKIVIVFNPATANAYFWVNALSSQVTNGTYSLTNNGHSPINRVLIGNAYQDASAVNYQFCELDIWPTVATGVGGASPTGDVATILGYLTAKWGS